MEPITLFYGVFFILVLASGITAKLCKEEYVGKAGLGAKSFWIFHLEGFTDKGRRLRKIFFVTSNLSLISFFLILILQDMNV